MCQAMLIINPSSGQEQALAYEASTITVLQKQYDHVTVRYTEQAGDAATFARQACAHHVNALITLGATARSTKVSTAWPNSRIVQRLAFFLWEP